MGKTKKPKKAYKPGICVPKWMPKLAGFKPAALEMLHIELFGKLSAGKPTLADAESWYACMLPYATAAQVWEATDSELKEELLQLATDAKEYYKRARTKDVFAFRGEELQRARRAPAAIQELLQEVPLRVVQECVMQSEAHVNRYINLPKELL